MTDDAQLFISDSYVTVVIIVRAQQDRVFFAFLNFLLSILVFFPLDGRVNHFELRISVFHLSFLAQLIIESGQHLH